MNKWTKERVNPETRVYRYGNTGYTVESRTKKIPHANGYPGTWDYTSFFVMRDGVDVCEYSRLKDAQDYVMKEVG